MDIELKINGETIRACTPESKNIGCPYSQRLEKDLAAAQERCRELEEQLEIRKDQSKTRGEWVDDLKTRVTELEKKTQKWQQLARVRETSIKEMQTENAELKRERDHLDHQYQNRVQDRDCALKNLIETEKEREEFKTQMVRELEARCKAEEEREGLKGQLGKAEQERDELLLSEKTILEQIRKAEEKTALVIIKQHDVECKACALDSHEKLTDMQDERNEVVQEREVLKQVVDEIPCKGGDDGPLSALRRILKERDELRRKLDNWEGEAQKGMGFRWTEKEVQILNVARARSGDEWQIDAALEEMAESIVSILHWRRGKVSKKEVIGELADVMIQTQQLRCIFGEELVDDEVQKKLCRVEESVQEMD